MSVRQSPAAARYTKRFALGMSAYVAIILAAIFVLDRFAPTGPLRYALAAAPALPILAIIASMGLYLVEEKDEVARAMLVHAMLWGLGFILALTTVWGFLEGLAGVPSFPLYMIFPIFCAGMGVSYPLIRARFGAA